MRRLWLMRHAKAGWGSDDDAERSLTGAGVRGAADAARYLASQVEGPLTVLCSSALRTRQTLEPIRAAMTNRVHSQVLESLYLASESELEETIRTQTDQVQQLLVLAHNPGIGELASQLAGNQHGPTSLGDLFPPAGMACFALDAPWTRFNQGAQLVSTRMG